MRISRAHQHRGAILIAVLVAGVLSILIHGCVRSASQELGSQLSRSAAEKALQSEQAIASRTQQIVGQASQERLPGRVTMPDRDESGRHIADAQTAPSKTTRSQISSHDPFDTGAPRPEDLARERARLAQTSQPQPPTQPPTRTTPQVQQPAQVPQQQAYSSLEELIARHAQRRQRSEGALNRAASPSLAAAGLDKPLSQITVGTSPTASDRIARPIPEQRTVPATRQSVSSSPVSIVASAPKSQTAPRTQPSSVPSTPQPITQVAATQSELHATFPEELSDVFGIWQSLDDSTPPLQAAPRTALAGISSRALSKEDVLNRIQPLITEARRLEQAGDLAGAYRKAYVARQFAIVNRFDLEDVDPAAAVMLSSLAEDVRTRARTPHHQQTISQPIQIAKTQPRAELPQIIPRRGPTSNGHVHQHRSVAKATSSVRSLQHPTTLMIDPQTGSKRSPSAEQTNDEWVSLDKLALASATAPTDSPFLSSGAQLLASEDVATTENTQRAQPVGSVTHALQTQSAAARTEPSSTVTSRQPLLVPHAERTLSMKATSSMLPIQAANGPQHGAPIPGSNEAARSVNPFQHSGPASTLPVWRNQQQGQEVSDREDSDELSTPSSKNRLIWGVFSLMLAVACVFVGLKHSSEKTSGIALDVESRSLNHGDDESSQRRIRKAA